MSREVQVRFCESRAVRSRPATHLVVMVFGTRQHAENLYDEIETVLSQVGLRLAPDKTRVTGIDEGFDFLGFHIQRHRQKGSDRRLIYTYPSKKSLATIRRKVTTVTGRQTTSLRADKLFLHLGQMTRGWALYFRHGSSSRAFGTLNHHLWWRPGAGCATSTRTGTRGGSSATTTAPASGGPPATEFGSSSPQR
jgi:RNA-directed DNA polymerase